MKEILSNTLFTDTEIPSRKSRLFEAGHMRLLVLTVLEKNPRYGYEIIKEIGNLVGCGYSPSTGTIYPTLSYLEDMKFIDVEKREGKRKHFTITVSGLDYLKDHKDQVENILGRLETRRKIQNNHQYLDIYRAMENLKTALKLQLNKTSLSDEKVYQIAQSIDQAAVEIGRMKNEENDEAV